MKRLLAVCFLSLAACNDALAPSPKQPAPLPPAASASTDVWAGHYIVVMRSGATSTPEALVHRHALNRQPTVDQRFGSVLHGFAAAVDDDDVERLRQDPDVERIEPDRIVHQMGTQTGMGWALDRIDQHNRPLNGDFAYGATGSGVNIYIVDGGIRYTHTEFGGRAHFAFDALGGNGSDCSGHGTGVAGIAGGSVHGVAKSATIWSVRVFPCSGSSALSTILAGVDWITAHHRSPAVANLSLGAGIAPILDSAVSKSIASGVTYVVAAGNSGVDACTMSPAKLKTAIAVGASDASDARASWSNYGSCIALFAPGAGVPSADYYSDVSLANWNGTSMSAPYVAGAAALYLQSHPSATPAQVRSVLMSNATGNVLSNLAGSTNRLLYTSFVGGTTPAPAPAPPPPPPPSGSFTASFTVSCNTRHSCTFDASKSTVPNGVSSYNWYFGDGYQGTTVKLTHDYSGKKTVSVTLKIYDKKLAYRYQTQTVVVP